MVCVGQISSTLNGDDVTRFQRKRLAAGLSQKALAEQLETDPTNVSKWENGKAIPMPEFFPKLAAIFNITAEEVTHLFDADPAPATT
jgi:transcriptional regulator with XRE-family HTH domain